MIRPSEAISKVAKSTVELAKGVAEGVGVAVKGAVNWASKKLEEVAKESDKGLGPYGSQATSAPSDFDPIASGVYSGQPLQDTSNNRNAKERSEERKKSEVSEEDKEKAIEDGLGVH